MHYFSFWSDHINDGFPIDTVINNTASTKLPHINNQYYLTSSRNGLAVSESSVI